jgi:hypothetical protein
MDFISNAWNDVQSRLIVQYFRACGITSTSIEEFNTKLYNTLLLDEQSETNSISAEVNDFTLTSSQQTNPFADDGIYYRQDQDSQLRIIMTQIPWRNRSSIPTRSSTSLESVSNFVSFKKTYFVSYCIYHIKINNYLMLSLNSKT